MGHILLSFICLGMLSISLLIVRHLTFIIVETLVFCSIGDSCFLCWIMRTGQINLTRWRANLCMVCIPRAPLLAVPSSFFFNLINTFKLSKITWCFWVTCSLAPYFCLTSLCLNFCEMLASQVLDDIVLLISTLFSPDSWNCWKLCWFSILLVTALCLSDLIVLLPSPRTSKHL